LLQFTLHLILPNKKQIGKDVLVTLRIPNIWEEKSFKLSRAYMSILSAAEFTNSLKLQSPPVFEVILPMTKRADQLIHIQETFQKTSKFTNVKFAIANPRNPKKGAQIPVTSALLYNFFNKRNHK